MDFQFLGTASGTPSRARNVSALALRAEGERRWSLIDCGEGTQHRILRTPLSLHDLDAVFITHMHGDHCYGLPGLLASAGMLNRSAPLTLVGPPPLRNFLDGVMATTELGLPYRLDVLGVDELPGLALPAFAVHATPLSHRLPSWAYTFVEQAVEARLSTERLRAAGVPPSEVWGRIQRREDVALPDGRLLRAADYLDTPRAPRRVIVAGDNDDPSLLLDEMRRADLLIHEATYTQAVLDKVGPGPRHSSARMVARAAAAAGLPNLVLTHFSPRYQDKPNRPGDPLSICAVEAEARADYHGALFLARDLERYRLDRQRVLARLD